MSKLHYKKESTEKLLLSPLIYKVKNPYAHPDLQKPFMQLRSHVADINPSMITKSILGTEQDFIMLMNKAKSYLVTAGINNAKTSKMLLQMFQDCIFGYYVLTPLLYDKYVSDIKVLSWDHITCKKNGERYLTDVKFESEDDYNKWYDRLLRIQGISRNEFNALQKHTDTKNESGFNLRLDFELSYITTSGYDNLHIRKIPKIKYDWDYLINNGLLDNDMKEYLYDRMAANYGFILSGKGGSGKTALLNNLIDIIPFNQSGLVVQESDELYSKIHPQLQFEHIFEWYDFQKGDYIRHEHSLEDMLRLGLLQDIDNFIVGETKGDEALHIFITGINTGSRFMGTLHSNTARDSVKRLVQLAMNASDYSSETLEQMMGALKFSLIHMSYFKIDEIVEVAGWDDVNKKLKYRNVYSCVSKPTEASGTDSVDQAEHLDDRYYLS